MGRLVMALARILSALALGLVFGFGLSMSGMLDPARVQGFLDIAGTWDPSLLFVLGGAVGVSALGYLISRRLAHPMLATAFQTPASRPVDLQLLSGSAIFGIGWGLSGFCPGPAMAALATGHGPVLVFAAAMLAGMIGHGFLSRMDSAARLPAPAPHE